jgi:chondroitin 4-sulfotransferase 11
MNIFRYVKFNSIKIPKILIKNIILYQDIDIYKNNYVVLPDHKLIYLVTPKSGCTSILSNLGLSYNIKTYTEEGREIHSHPDFITELRIIRKKYNKFFKFTFVRNPISRIVSCYKDKILGHENYENYYFDNYHYKIKSDISFEEFIKVISNIPDFLADRHFKSQYFSIVKNNKYKIDYIGKIENIDYDWQKLAIKYNLNSKMPHKNKSDSNNNYFDFYNIKTAELIYRRYKNDFKYFGYLDDYLKLITYLKTKEK